MTERMKKYFYGNYFEPKSEDGAPGYGTDHDQSTSSVERSNTQHERRGTDHGHQDESRKDGPDLNVMDGVLKNYLDLQEVLAEVGLADQLESPSIVVIGDQGAGKSTVLELLSQITLPRDTKIATRCPIHITMRNSPSSQIDINYRVPQSDRQGRAEEKRFSNLVPEAVKEYLEAAQKEMVGDGKEVCSDPILLKVSGPTLPDLAIIDLPGLNYTDPNLTTEIELMIQKWVEKPNTVIVVVFPCTGDIATTQAIQMARNVDPNFDRTMCVLTKPDLALEKQVQLDVKQLASNKHESVKFKRGFVVVRGKGADESGISIAEARQREKEFFENHKMFRELYKNNKAGTDTLIKIVSRIIHQIARKNLPLLVGEIRTMYRQAEAKKKSYPVCFEDDSSKYLELSKIVSGITKDFEELTLEMKSTAECKDIGFKPNRVAYDYFSSEVLKALRPEPIDGNGDLYEEIRLEFIEHRGPEPRGFTRYHIYQNLVKRKMQHIEDIAMETLAEVETNVWETLQHLLQKHVHRFPTILELTEKQTKEVFNIQLDACKQYLATFFKLEVKPFISDYNLQNVPLSLTSDKRKYQLLPTKLEEICDDLSKSEETKTKMKGFLKTIPVVLGLY